MRRAQAWLARAAAGVVALVLLVGVLRGGERYLYCPAMQAIMDTPCCDGDRHKAHHGEPAVERRSRGCCEEHVLAKLPAAASGPAARDLREALAAPFAGLVPTPSESAVAQVVLTGARFERECRAGPIALMRHRAELMVALN